MFEKLFRQRTGNSAGADGMTTRELASLFPEIPKDLHAEPVLAEFAATFGDLLRQARDPSACSQQYSAANYYYLKLVSPMKIYMYGLTTKDKVLAQLREMLDHHARDAEGFRAGLAPTDAGQREVRGPGCD